ncbi:hypothetical protein BGL_1c19160 [Burkholderia plantarii]|uniref:Uncharacterized protein n=1 Tax=Burkholderia plantarii TaxID=41899 RepID=A0A0B6RZD8_BURPL|nr:hypothetical protein BGL_1c19160 [Burkholderia plantarii]
MRPSGSLRHLSDSFACIIAGSGPGHSTYPTVRICTATSISFVYRWTPHGEVHVLETPRATLIAQLAAARDFLFSAAENGEMLELSL